MPASNQSHRAGHTYFVSVPCAAVGHGFFDDACCKYYLIRLLNSLNNYHVRLHAYCLLHDEIFLLLTPGTVTGISNLLAHLNLAYSNYFNRRFRRKARVWSDSVFSYELDRDDLVLFAQKYVERLPVTRKLVLHGGVYKWSRYCCNAFGGSRLFLSPHPAFLRYLGSRTGNAFEQYRAFIARNPETPMEYQLVSMLQPALVATTATGSA